MKSETGSERGPGYVRSRECGERRERDQGGQGCEWLRFMVLEKVRDTWTRWHALF